MEIFKDFKAREDVRVLRILTIIVQNTGKQPVLTTENSRTFEIVVEHDTGSITRDERDFKNTRLKTIAFGAWHIFCNVAVRRLRLCLIHAIMIMTPSIFRLYGSVTSREHRGVSLKFARSERRRYLAVDTRNNVTKNFPWFYGMILIERSILVKAEIRLLFPKQNSIA